MSYIPEACDPNAVAESFGANEGRSAFRKTLVRHLHGVVAGSWQVLG